MANNSTAQEFTPQEFSKEIKNDIKGQFEEALEKKAFAAVNKLKKEGKMSQEEIVLLYRTNFKKFLQVDVQTPDILVQKISQIDNVTKKLLALSLSKQTKSKESTSLGLIDNIKSVMYRPMNIDSNITKNSSTKNVMKWVIDEIMSLPEMVKELISSPIQFAKWLKVLLEWETWKKLRLEITNVGLNTPQQQYQTGRSWMMAVLMLLPWAIGKTLLGIGKQAGKVAMKTMKSVWKEGVKKTSGKVMNKVSTQAGHTVEKTKQWLKSQTAKVKNTLEKPIEKIKARMSNTKAKETVSKTTKDIQSLWNDIATKNTELLAAKSNLKIKNLKADRIKELTDTIAKLEKEIPDLVKKQKEMNKTLRIAKKEVSTTNTKIGIDNNKVWLKKRYETNANKLWNDIATKNTELLAVKNNLKIKNLKADRIKELNDKVMKLEKEITDLTKKQKDILDKAKNMNLAVTKTPRESIRKVVVEKLQETTQININRLKALRDSPHRLSLVKDLFSLRNVNSNIKRLSQSNKSIEGALSKQRKNWKTALENAKINPKFWNNKNILAKERVLASQKKWLKNMENIQNSLKHKIYNQLTWVGVITLANIQDLSDEHVFNIAEYLYEENDNFIMNDFANTWLTRWSIDIGIPDTSSLDGLSIEELKATKLIVTWLASKTWTQAINENIAQKRAENTKEFILKNYPWLQAENIDIKYSLQPSDNDDDVSLWQWTKVGMKTENFAYVEWYSKQESTVV